jgi:hypothetical protein
VAFRSAVDWWFYAVIAVAVAVAVVAVLPVMATGSPGQIAFGVGTLLFAVGLPLWLLFSTEYRVVEQALLVRSGPFRWTIPLAEISSVRESNSALSSPALSLKRLEVKYGGGKSILVSPADRDGFLAAIGRRLD